MVIHGYKVTKKMVIKYLLSYYQITAKKIALAILKTSLLVATFAFYFCTLQTVWTKVSLELIWIQTIWHYDGISERIILRLFILRNDKHKKLA